MIPFLIQLFCFFFTFLTSIASAEVLQIEIELPSKPNEVKIITENDILDAEYKRLKKKKYLIFTRVDKVTDKLEYKNYAGMAKIKQKLYFTKFKEDKEISFDKIKKIEESIDILQVEIERESKKYNKLKQSVVQKLGFNSDDVLELELEKKENDKLNWIYSNLKRLIKFPRNDNVYRSIKTVSEHLQKAARTTAKTERIGKKRKKAALNRLKRQLKVAKYVDESDLYSLTNELISLKKERLELENSFFGNQF